MNRRRFLGQLLSLPVVAPFISAFAPRLAIANPATPGLFRLAFGSCALEWRAQPIWTSILASQPDVFAFLGDNIYADTDDMNLMSSKYAKLAAIPQFAEFRRQIPIIATWDDHDYGHDEAGLHFPKKQESKDLMLDFFGEPANSARRRREGIYTSYSYSSAHEGVEKRVQVILLDLRWFRTELKVSDEGRISLPDLLGEQQWKWLERQLRRPADLRILGSSTQLVSSVHPWEKWADFPHEKERLFKMIDNLGVKNLIVISGDMHFGELSMEKTAAGTPIFDLTSSGLNQFEEAKGIDNPHRLALFDTGVNFGVVTVDWKTRRVLLEVRNGDGAAVITRLIQIPLA